MAHRKTANNTTISTLNRHKETVVISRTHRMTKKVANSKKSSVRSQNSNLTFHTGTLTTQQISPMREKESEEQVLFPVQE